MKPFPSAVLAATVFAAFSFSPAFADEDIKDGDEVYIEDVPRPQPPEEAAAEEDDAEPPPPVVPPAAPESEKPAPKAEKPAPKPAKKKEPKAPAPHKAVVKKDANDGVALSVGAGGVIGYWPDIPLGNPNPPPAIEYASVPQGTVVARLRVGSFSTEKPGYSWGVEVLADVSQGYLARRSFAGAGMVTYAVNPGLVFGAGGGAEQSFLNATDGDGTHDANWFGPFARAQLEIGLSGKDHLTENPTGASFLPFLQVGGFGTGLDHLAEIPYRGMSPISAGITINVVRRVTVDPKITVVEAPEPEEVEETPSDDGEEGDTEDVDDTDDSSEPAPAEEE